MALTLTAIAVLGVFAIRLREGRERMPDAERVQQTSDDRSVAPDGAVKA